MHNPKAALKSLLDGVRHARVEYWRFRYYDRLKRQRDEAFATYNGSPRGLHLGAANVALPRWFNTDLEPFTNGVYYLDATQPFPFPANSFDFIFFEHMIEHVPFSAGLQMLAECRRVLKPSGVVRIATPNLQTVLALATDKSSATQNYLNWAIETFKLPAKPFPQSTQVINNFFRAWGHQFLYDSETLRRAMEQAGLQDITQHQVGVSDHAFLQGLEHHGDAIGSWVNEFETMVFEGNAVE